jgi:hypothetical protein
LRHILGRRDGLLATLHGFSGVPDHLDKLVELVGEPPLAVVGVAAHPFARLVGQ